MKRAPALLLALCAWSGCDMAETETVDADFVAGGFNRLRIVGSGYSGAPLTSNPPGINCQGGEGPGCIADFPNGSRVELVWPGTISANGQGMTLLNYYCEGEQTTTVTGASGRTLQTLFLYENFACTAYYR